VGAALHDDAARRPVVTAFERLVALQIAHFSTIGGR
jgi:hypothetical protein